MNQETKKISIVIPAYNEEELLEKELEKIVFKTNEIINGADYEIILVENGSLDNTLEIANKLSVRYAQIRVISLPTASYGNALKEGILKSNGKYLAVFNVDFWDTDAMKKVLDIFLNDNYDVVVCSKSMKGAQDLRPLSRRIVTKAFNLILRLLFGYRGTDTHGIKFFKRKKVLPIIQQCKTIRDLFDTEIIIRAQKAGLSIKEIPIVCEEKRKSVYGIFGKTPRILKDLIVMFISIHKRSVSGNMPNAAFYFFKKYFWLIILVAVPAIGLWNFQTSPGFWFDEGIIVQAAKNIAVRGIYGIQVAPEQFYTDNFWITTSYSLIFQAALFIKIFGASIWAARLAALLYLTFFVFVSYFFIKKLYGFKIAVLSSSLLATFSPLYGNGKAVLGEVPGLFWLISGALAYLAHQDKKERKFLFLGALFWGIGASTKPYYLLFGLSVLFILVFLWLIQKSVDLKTIILFCVVFSLPVFLWFYLSFDFSSWHKFQDTLSFFLNSYGASSFEPLKNLLRFATESTPVHFTFLIAFILAALFIQEGGWRNTNSVIAGFLVFIFVSFLWYLKTPGWYRYFFPIHVLAILFFPASLIAVAERIGVHFQKEKIVKTLGMIIIGALIIFQAGFLIINYNQFYNDSPLRLKEYVEKNIPENSSVFIVNLPEAAFLLNYENLYQYIFINENLAIKSDIKEYSTDYIIANSSDDKFIFDNKNLIGFEYVLEQKIGRYAVYKKNIHKSS